MEQYFLQHLVNISAISPSLAESAIFKISKTGASVEGILTVYPFLYDMALGMH